MISSHGRLRVFDYTLSSFNFILAFSLLFYANSIFFNLVYYEFAIFYNDFSPNSPCFCPRRLNKRDIQAASNSGSQTVRLDLGPQYPSIEFALTPHNVWTADSRVYQRVGAGREPGESQVYVDSDCFMGGLLLSHEGVASFSHCNGLVSPLCVCIGQGHVICFLILFMKDKKDYIGTVRSLSYRFLRAQSTWRLERKNL